MASMLSKLTLRRSRPVAPSPLRRLALATLATGGLAVACSDAASPSAAQDGDASEDAVTVDTSTPAARAQHDANVAFANEYRARCGDTGGAATGRKRVLVTGFGRFLDNTTNATGLVVSRLLPAAEYPVTAPPAAGEVDPPGPQTRVARAVVTLPQVGEADVCAMILPVSWDLSAILVAKEIEAFQPDAVFLNGIAGERQDLWIELGSINRAMALRDGSDRLVPVPPQGETHAPLVPGAASSETTKGLRLSWTAVRAAARAAVEAEANVAEPAAAATGGDEEGEGKEPVLLKDVLLGAKLAGYPRSSNTYLCNNLSYVVNYLMDHPGRRTTLLRASEPTPGKPRSVTVSLTRDLRTVPRVFMHWPSTLKGAHLDAGARVLAAVLGSQLAAVSEGAPASSAPTTGSNDLADIQASGTTF